MATRSLLVFRKPEIFGASLSEKERLEVFREIYDKSHLLVRRTLRGMVPENWVDDLVQEVFLRIWTKGGAFENRSNWKTWIYRIAVNVAIDELRKRAIPTELLSEDLPAPNSAVSDYLLSRWIQNGVLSLDEKIRPVFVLYYQQECSVEEVSSILGIPAGTVKSRLHRARDEFCKFLKRNGVSYE